MALSACGGGKSNEPIGTVAAVSGYFGSVATDEPRATLAGRDVLANNGSAVDAAVATAFTLAVTLPSRAGVGGGGACLVHDARAKKTEAMLFPAVAPASTGPLPAAVPMMARGLFAMHARYGRLRWEQTLSAAEGFARFGYPVSRALAADLARHGERLAGDPEMTAVLLGPGRAPLAEGTTLTQVALAAFLTRIRSTGPGDFHAGRSALEFSEAARLSGAAISADDLRRAIPAWAVPPKVRFADEEMHWLPAPITGSEVAAQQWRRLADGGEYRRGGAAVARDASPVDAGTADGSTGFVVTDREGSAVACVLAMGRPFGLGRSARGTGILLAGPTDGAVARTMAAAMLINTNVNEFFLAAAAAGGSDAPSVLNGAMAASLIAQQPLDQVFTGLSPQRSARANIVACPAGAPRKSETCGTRADPRGAGLAAFPGQ
ncbi:gamma-glutamyltransferase [Allostella humosa]|uniref:gamma-glutamyltransferase n=1 Tax=Stella humosa TaxID=94 RepID=UPI001476AD08|nr:gamma-glutamyltransferase [Stella humosa]